MPGWLILAVLTAAIGVAIWIAVSNTRHKIARTLARRPNPTQSGFVAMLSEDVRSETAEFLWATMIFYLEPGLTPHPDDHLVDDLPIDEDEPALLWLPDFAELHGVDSRQWPQWPEAWEGNVRNFARWLEAGLPPRKAETS